MGSDCSADGDAIAAPMREDASAASRHDADGIGDRDGAARGVELDDGFPVYRPRHDPHEILVERERRDGRRVRGVEVAALPTERDSLATEFAFVRDDIA